MIILLLIGIFVANLIFNYLIMRTNLFFKIMMNRQFFVFLLMFSSIGFNAQISAFPWTETFEDSSPTRVSWTQIHETNNVNWTFVATATTGSVGVTAFEGTKFANFPANTSSADKTKLVSPPFNTAGLTSPKISFYLINPQLNGNANWVRIYYRMSATDPWITLLGFQPPFASWFHFANIGMPPNIYQVAIECENAQGYSTLIDGVTISNDDLSTHDISKLAKILIKYYPNPAKEVLNFTSDERMEEINIYDAAGKKVLTNRVDADNGNINVSRLSNGMYIISGKTEKGNTEPFKMIKK
ncbi:hypothetical protein QF044_000417 [Chryseobacterium sp. W4I1]|nr:hypothetical protein [Chryseobacterium sp. W4I1]